MYLLKSENSSMVGWKVMIVQVGFLVPDWSGDMGVTMYSGNSQVLSTSMFLRTSGVVSLLLLFIML
jgi:hypothetical protein